MIPAAEVYAVAGRSNGEASPPRVGSGFTHCHYSFPTRGSGTYPGINISVWTGPDQERGYLQTSRSARPLTGLGDEAVVEVCDPPSCSDPEVNVMTRVPGLAIGVKLNGQWENGTERATAIARAILGRVVK